MNHEEIIVSIDNVTVSYGADVAVDRVSVGIICNSTTAIFGPNGSGKSPLAQGLAGHEAYKVTGGSVAFDGKDLGSPIDLYDFSKVSSTGVLTFPTGRLASGAHHLSVRITGANPNAKQSRFIGLDYVRLSPAK